ncbi:MAG: hypothetical protein WBM41_09580 [Arenicellales bacterium]
MTELLTKDEYHALADSLEFPANAFINGGYRPAACGKTFETLNPGTGEKLTDVAAGESVD